MGISVIHSDLPVSSWDAYQGNPLPKLGSCPSSDEVSLGIKPCGENIFRKTNTAERTSLDNQQVKNCRYSTIAGEEELWAWIAPQSLPTDRKKNSIQEMHPSFCFFFALVYCSGIKRPCLHRTICFCWLYKTVLNLSQKNRWFRKKYSHKWKARGVFHNSPILLQPSMILRSRFSGGLGHCSRVCVSVCVDKDLFHGQSSTYGAWELPLPLNIFGQNIPWLDMYQVGIKDY